MEGPGVLEVPLKLDAPADPETFTKLLHVVGDRARDANRVEVPFEFIAPPPEDYWTSDSARGSTFRSVGRGPRSCNISGSAGDVAARSDRRQNRVGQIHLLHALITNAALRYSPDELELYLIDFKKGVEFKVYATLQLPHARVIAVESEREFGLSVLQRLDGELKQRGDQFRDLGVQDLNGYRQLADQPPLPRDLAGRRRVPGVLRRG